MNHIILHSTLCKAVSSKDWTASLLKVSFHSYLTWCHHKRMIIMKLKTIQQKVTCSKSTIETLEKCVTYVQKLTT